MLYANNPALRSWIEVPADSDFPIQNIPFGIFKTEWKSPRLATIIGNTVVDLAVLAQLGFLEGTGAPKEVFVQPSLNAFIALGKEITRSVRNRIAFLLEAQNAELRDSFLVRLFLEDAARFADPAIRHLQPLHTVSDVELLLPVQIGDYTDFYSSRDHATNVGIMFRDPQNALLPNWLHIPVGYHGRASSIVVSGTPIRRPKGQMRPDDSQPPVFGACKQLDFELEVAFVVGKSNEMGDAIPIAQAEDYIFGLTLFNDWSARDIQKWEYVPLGPFLAKNFGSTMSPWVVTLDALEPFRTAGEPQSPEVFDYLKIDGKRYYDIQLEVLLQPENGEPFIISNSNFKYMYWSMAQQLAHHTVNGCNMNVGDVCASGTISGPTPNSYGSMLELAWKGTKPIQLPDGTERKFILDGDTVIIRGYGLADGVRIGFGEASGKVLPAKI